MTLVDLLVLLDDWGCDIAQDLLFSPSRPLTGEEMAALKRGVREHKDELIRRAKKAPPDAPAKVEGENVVHLLEADNAPKALPGASRQAFSP
jgi:hypothetical protein